MILAAYLLAALAIGWGATSGRRWLASHEPVVRGVGGCVAVVVAAVLVGTALATSWRGETSVLTWVMAVASAAGAVVFIVGLARSQGRAAWNSRLLGWLLLIVPILLPSTLTLMLPFVGALFVLVVGANNERSDGEGSIADRSGYSGA